MGPHAAHLQSNSHTIFTPEIKELVALGAALACNCESCLRYHYREAKKLGVSDEDIRAAFEMAAMVKQQPARNAQALSERLLSSKASGRSQRRDGIEEVSDR